ncbi:MAG: hypothetical protein WC547_09860, partial [Candidatus Omnitrophota bacterium]
PENYAVVSFDALKMGMTQGDITTQAKGLLCVWAEQIKRIEAARGPRVSTGSAVPFDDRSAQVRSNAIAEEETVVSRASSRRRTQAPTQCFSVGPDAYPELTEKIQRWNRMYHELGREKMVEAVLNDGDMRAEMFRLIRAQDRSEDSYGVVVNRECAETLKTNRLRQAVRDLGERDIFILQMEYELSTRFLKAFSGLLRSMGCTQEDAKYNTGELAKILMAGGLGSFKPDLVRGWYRVLADEFYGGAELSANKKLHAIGVLYSSAIKGTGPIAPRGAVAGQDIVDIARKHLRYMVTYQIPLNISYFDEGRETRLGTVSVDIYMNPYSELQEYWLYCPQVFHEAYCGEFNSNSYRGVQTLVYRKVLLRFIKDGIARGDISRKLLFSTSEVNTTLAIPRVIDDQYRGDKDFSDLIVHHYNHTIVDDGIHYYKPFMFDVLKIHPEFLTAKTEERVNLLQVTGQVSDFITGCSSLHTKVLREKFFKDFEEKVVEDELFGNSEGSDVERWQGGEMRCLIYGYMMRLGIIDNDTNGKIDHLYPELFERLEEQEALKEEFMHELMAAKRKQKNLFIGELFRGTFGALGFTQEEAAAAGVDYLHNPFFTFVRRVVPYKCHDFIVDTLFDALDDVAFRQFIIDAKPVIFIGGRSFHAPYTARLRARMEELFVKEPRLRYQLIFIDNHNVFTSWMIQQATDFGGMLSWYGIEAGPTSYSNAQLNGAPTFATLDGVIPERLLRIVRNQANVPVSGTGYVVEYNVQTKDGQTVLDENGQPKYRHDNDGKIRPNRQSFIEQLKAACADYHNPENYAVVSFDALKMGMTQGDITTQAKGLLCVWAEQIKRIEAAYQLAAYPARATQPAARPRVILERLPGETRFRIVSVENPLVVVTGTGADTVSVGALSTQETSDMFSRVELILEGILMHAPPEKAIRVQLLRDQGLKVFAIHQTAGVVTFFIHWALLENPAPMFLADLRRHELAEFYGMDHGLSLQAAHTRACNISLEAFRSDPASLLRFLGEASALPLTLDKKYYEQLGEIALAYTRALFNGVVYKKQISEGQFVEHLPVDGDTLVLQNNRRTASCSGLCAYCGTRSAMLTERRSAAL